MTSLAPGRADLDLSAAGPPRSRAFGDVYFSADGLEEARAVFLTGCGLPEAWAGRRRFVIGELGFGSGLNLLAAWDLWARTRPAGGLLHFVSVEGFPLTAAEAQTVRRATPALSAGRGDPDLVAKCDALHAAWPPRIKGVHRRWLSVADGVVLTVAHLEAGAGLDALEFAAEAWFLDGFSPAANPDMWAPELFAQIAARTAPGGRAATFSVAGAVRRGLEAAGFAAVKQPGFGAKRERLEARYAGPAASPARSPLCPAFAARPQRALIVGAGIAGACVAHALARRGVETCVLTADAAPAQGASGAAAGLVMARIDRDDRSAARFLRTAYASARHAYAGLGAAYAPVGVVELAGDGAAEARHAALVAAAPLPADMLAQVSASEASDRAGATLERGGLWHAGAGVARPGVLVEALLGGARVVVDAPVARVARGGDGWRAMDATGRVLATGDVCVLACGPALARFDQTSWLPVRLSRGQTSRGRSASPPACAVVYGGYALPAGPGEVVFGATYDDWSDVAAGPADPGCDARNLAAFADAAPALAAGVEVGSLIGRAAVRATTPDHLPYAGPCPDARAYRDRFAGLARGRPVSGPPGPVVEGLYVLGGLGSRGLVTAPALGEALAAEICGEPGALERGAAEAAHPARALVRALKRG